VKPDARLHWNTNPAYLRGLIESAGISQREAARRLGISDRALRYYLAGKESIPYPSQFCLESLAEAPEGIYPDNPPA
jgi:transcriptional regulator with XRE-family HTH domain